MPPITRSSRPAERGHASHRYAGVVVVLLATISFGVVAYSMHVKRMEREMSARTERYAGVLIDSTKAAFRRIALLRGSEARALRTSRNDDHLARARRLGIAGISTRDAAERLLDNPYIVKLQDNAYYRVARMDYSVPYVTRSTGNLLTVIGRRFQHALREAGLPPYQFIITSATRTREDQRALRRINVNAATKSAHEHGTTVDIHYERFAFAYKPTLMKDSTGVYHDVLNQRVGEAWSHLALTRQQKLKAILGRVLEEMQDEGLMLVRYERRQPVYHLTLGRDIADPGSEPALVPGAGDAVDTTVTAPAGVAGSSSSSPSP